jgi:nucleoside-diphosphate-sugar epimerase/predicted dehydrogenase
MSHAPVRVGILGAGYISDPHLAALARLPEVETVAVCDLSRGRAEALAAQYGVPKTYRDMHEMLANERLDAVHVLTPPEVHERIAAPILGAGVDVLLEKPMCETAESSRRLAALAAEKKRHLGVSHNFLFFEPYERLRADVKAGRFGDIDQIDIVWNKELGQVKMGPHAGWLFERPEHVLVEVGPHTFAHLLDLVGDLDRVSVTVGDRTDLPLGREFYRRWEALGWKGTTSVRLRWSFIGGYPEHYIHVRGRSASGYVDFERNTYVMNEHTAQMLDLDRFAISARTAQQALGGGVRTLGRYMLGKLGVVEGGKPFPDSIASAVSRFYEGRRHGRLDERLGVRIGVGAVALAERLGREAKLRVRAAAPVPAAPAPRAPSGAVVPTALVPTALVLGGTGFIGRALVKKLVESGRGVRVLARDPRSPHPELRLPGVEVVRGDFTDTPTVEAALGGIEVVYHLARGHGMKWAEYLKYDVEPTMRLARACEKAGVKRFFYTSTIAIYWAGKRAGTIREATPPHPGVTRTSLYARSKVEIEKQLLELGRSSSLEVAIFRPGVVIGRGGSPLHWGVGAWPYPSVCRLWGDGNHPLPFVLVEDCADALVRALEKPNLHNKSYNLVGDAALTGNEYLDALERHAGIHIKRVVATPGQLFLEESAKWVIKSAGRDGSARLPSWYDGDGRTLAAPFDCNAAKEDLGWRPTGDRATLVREGIELPADEFLS